MKAKEGVLDRLEQLIVWELSLSDRYLLYGCQLANWGYLRLASKFHELAEHERKDARRLLEHLLYLEGSGTLAARPDQTCAAPAPCQALQEALEAEQGSVEQVRAAIAHCASVGDFTTRKLLEELITDEEQHIDWLETQRDTMKQLGLELYLSQQIRPA